MAKELIKVVPINDPNLTEGTEAATMYYRDTKTGEITHFTGITKDRRRLAPYDYSMTAVAGAGLKGERIKAKQNRAQLNFNKLQFGYGVTKELIPVIGTVFLFVILLGFGSAGLNIIFSGNNLYWFIGIILALLFFVKKKAKK